MVGWDRTFLVSYISAISSLGIWGLISKSAMNTKNTEKNSSIECGKKAVIMKMEASPEMLRSAFSVTFVEGWFYVHAPQV